MCECVYVYVYVETCCVDCICFIQVSNCCSRSGKIFDFFYKDFYCSKIGAMQSYNSLFSTFGLVLD